MPRKARLDAEGAIHHVIVRGIEHRRIFDDDGDRRNFVLRLAAIAVETETTIYAWALLPNHAHALVRSGPHGISKFMRRLLTGYAVTYNRRHERHGYLFQNRYKSILCEEEPYFRELVRYIHLNPLRAGLVDSLSALETYPWCGHSFVVHGSEYPWHDVSSVLSRFGDRRGEARRCYREFLESGIREETSGGKRRKWKSDWSLLEWLKNVIPADEPEGMVSDGRVLGGKEFVGRLGLQMKRLPSSHAAAPEELIRAECRRSGLSVDALLSGGRCSNIAELRAKLVHELIQHPGMTLTRIGDLIGISKSGVSKILSRDT